MMNQTMSIYFIHSQTNNYNERLYLPVLRSEYLSHHELIFPTSEKNNKKYFKDLMMTATLFIVDLTYADAGEMMEVKEAITSRKPTFAIADNSVGYEEKYAKYFDRVVGYSNEEELRHYVEEFVKSFEGRVNDRNEVDSTVILGVLN